MFHGAFSTVPGKRQRLLERQSLGIHSPITFCQGILVGLIEADFQHRSILGKFMYYHLVLRYVPERIHLFPTFQSWILPGSVPPNVPLMISYGPSVSWRNCDVVGTFEGGTNWKKQQPGCRCRCAVHVIACWISVKASLCSIHLSLCIYTQYSQFLQFVFFDA